MEYKLFMLNKTIGQPNKQSHDGATLHLLKRFLFETYNLGL